MPEQNSKQYSQMTDDEKLKILITELKRDENDMSFKPQDRFVFDVDVPWWVSVFSKMRFTIFIIPLIFVLILILIIGVPAKDMRLWSMMLVIIFYSLDVLDRKKLKDNTQQFDDNNAASTLEFLYRASLLPKSGYSTTFFLKKIIIKAMYCFFAGVFLFSLIFFIILG